MPILFLCSVVDNKEEILIINNQVRFWKFAQGSLW